MNKMTLHPLPERISLTLYNNRGGDKANEGWFFLSPAEWEKYKVKLSNSTAGFRTIQPKPWHDIDVYSPDDFDAAIRDLESEIRRRLHDGTALTLKCPHEEEQVRTNKLINSVDALL